jgi:hypothetical protein
VSMLLIGLAVVLALVLKPLTAETFSGSCQAICF